MTKPISRPEMTQDKQLARARAIYPEKDVLAYQLIDIMVDANAIDAYYIRYGRYPQEYINTVKDIDHSQMLAGKTTMGSSTEGITKQRLFHRLRAITLEEEND